MPCDNGYFMGLPSSIKFNNTVAHREVPVSVLRHVLLHYKGLVSQFGILGFQEKKFGFWDFALFEIGILEIRCEIVISQNKQSPSEHGILRFNPPEIGILAFCPYFEIGILGFHPCSNLDCGIPGPSLTGPYYNNTVSHRKVPVSILEIEHSECRVSSCYTSKLLTSTIIIK